MARKPPKVRLLKPTLKAIDHRTCPPPPRTFASRVAQDPTLAFYSTKPWRDLRAAVLAERGPRCERCGAHADRPYLDHIKELRDGGEPLDRANLQVLCASCHTTKSGQARAARFGLI